MVKTDQQRNRKVGVQQREQNLSEWTGRCVFSAPATVAALRGAAAEVQTAALLLLTACIRGCGGGVAVA